jgi:hypothetical protein
MDMGEMNQKIFELGIIPSVLNILHHHYEVEGDRFHPKNWEHKYENWLYERGGEVPSVYEFKFEWKRFLGNFIMPNSQMIKESGLIGSFFRGVGKAEIWLRVEPKGEDFVFHLEFSPHKRHVGKLHNNLTTEETKEIIREYVTGTF